MTAGAFINPKAVYRRMIAAWYDRITAYNTWWGGLRSQNKSAGGLISKVVKLLADLAKILLVGKRRSYLMLFQLPPFLMQAEVFLSPGPPGVAMANWYRIEQISIKRPATIVSIAVKWSPTREPMPNVAQSFEAEFIPAPSTIRLVIS